jgi:hypothetical protein
MVLPLLAQRGRVIHVMQYKGIRRNDAGGPALARVTWRMFDHIKTISGGLWSTREAGGKLFTEFRGLGGKGEKGTSLFARRE